jgi:prostaglandin reductase 1
MSSTVARKFTLIKHFEGAPKLTDFKLVEENLRELNDGEILCKAEFLSVDPYMRGASTRMNLGDTMPGVQVSRVLKSRNPEFLEGEQVVAHFGWRDLTINKPAPNSGSNPDVGALYKIPDMKGLPDSYALGSVGRPGNTGYFGFLRVCEPKPGNTVVVSAAAGAVGSLVAQIAKIQGCKVIAFAGTEDKINWLKNVLKIENVFNYKTVDMSKILKEVAPEGVDCYFDNVGGEFSYHVMRSMNKFGRIALCGAISSYNRDSTTLPSVPIDYTNFIYNELRMEGIHVLRWRNEWFEGINQLRDWILEVINSLAKV